MTICSASYLSYCSPFSPSFLIRIRIDVPPSRSANSDDCFSPVNTPGKSSESELIKSSFPWISFTCALIPTSSNVSSPSSFSFSCGGSFSSEGFSATLSASAAFTLFPPAFSAHPGIHKAIPATIPHTKTRLIVFLILHLHCFLADI